MEKNENHDNAGVKLPPPLLFLGLGLIGVGMEYVMPLSVGIHSPANYLGIGVIILSIGSIMSLSRLFKRHDTNIEPWKTTSKIITTCRAATALVSRERLEGAVE